MIWTAGCIPRGAVHIRLKGIVVRLYLSNNRPGPDEDGGEDHDGARGGKPLPHILYLKRGCNLDKLRIATVDELRERERGDRSVKERRWAPSNIWRCFPRL